MMSAMPGTPPRMTLSATVLDAPDARALAAFYQRLLGWEVGHPCCLYVPS
jgi:hypothetical protein